MKQLNSNMKTYTKTIDGKQVIKARSQIVLRITKEVNGEQKTFQVINPTEEMILADGWVEYVAPELNSRTKSKFEVIQELVISQWNNRVDISNSEALDYAVIVYPFESLLGQELPLGKIVSYENALWRVRQTHTAQENWYPSIDNASLWEIIQVEHSGTEEDPIPYNPPMEIFKDKYYIEDEVLYKCIRDSGTALSHYLFSLVGLYVEVV